MLRPLLISTVAVLELYTAKLRPTPPPPAVAFAADQQLADAAAELGRRAEAVDAELALAATTLSQDQSPEAYADVERLMPMAPAEDHALRVLWRIVTHRYGEVRRVAVSH